MAKFLDEWCRQVMRSRIEPMKKIARSLREHRELILNYFRAQKLLSSGVVEGLNNKAKLTNEKILRIPHLPLSRTRPLSLTWQITGAGINPRFFLTNQKTRPGRFVPGLRQCSLSFGSDRVYHADDERNIGRAAKGP